jgi:MHS family shikimate/dehydroshikimate transporter-like MFS transporter
VFFPSFDPLTGTLAAFGTYAVGFFARPFGGIVFGHFGDKVGRKTMLLLTLVLMGVPTGLIGLIPSYDSIGYWGAALLVLMRIVQGIAVGGEWGGAVLMAVEHAPKGKKGFFGSLPQAGMAPGLVISSLAIAAVSRLPESEMLSWGWRIPFLASVVLLIVGYLIRIKVAESPDFEKMKAKGSEVALPAAEVFRKYPGPLAAVVGARFAEVTWFYTVATFSLTYATSALGLDRAIIPNAIVIGAGIAFFTIPLVGMASDHVGQRVMFMTGGILLALYSPMFFILLNTKDPFWIGVAVTLAIAGVQALLYAPEAGLFSAQFPAEVRYSGISLGVQISGAIGGGIAPLVATYLLKAGGGQPYLIVTYLVVLGVVALGSAVAMRSPYEN